MTNASLKWKKGACVSVQCNDDDDDDDDDVCKDYVNVKTKGVKNYSLRGGAAVGRREKNSSQCIFA